MIVKINCINYKHAGQCLDKRTKWFFGRSCKEPYDHCEYREPNQKGTCPILPKGQGK